MEVCRDRPLVSREYLEASSQIMLSVASYLCLERMVYIKNEDLPVKIDAYISEHFTEDIDVTHICEKFMIGRTPLYEMTKQIYGTGLAEHIRYLRVEKAKQLLKENPDMRVSEIADACGFQDYNYFITVFKKITGMPPRKFREAAGQVTP